MSQQLQPSGTTTKQPVYTAQQVLGRKQAAKASPYQSMNPSQQSLYQKVQPSNLQQTRAKYQFGIFGKVLADFIGLKNKLLMNLLKTTELNSKLKTDEALKDRIRVAMEDLNSVLLTRVDTPKQLIAAIEKSENIVNEILLS
jgi:hypothetical protein